MSTKIIILVICMMAVTYIPRVLPAFVVGKVKLGKKTEKFLKLIPYTAMSALIFPGVFLIENTPWYCGVIGGGVAAVLAYLKCPVIVCVIAAIAVNFAVLSFV